MKSKWLVSLGLVVCLLMAFALPMCAPAPPVEEEKPPVVEEELAKSISAYVGLGEDRSNPMRDFIKEELGVDVHMMILGFGEIGAKLEAEAPRFGADLVIAGAPQAAKAKAEGWLIPYASPTWQGAGDIYVDPDNTWFNIGTFSFVLVGNKDMLAEAGYALPESWDDLLDPKWKGQIVMPSPLESGTAYMMLYSFLALKDGEEGLWEFYDKLDKNIDHYTTGGNVPSELVGRGEFMLGITSDEAILHRIDVGYPIVWTVPKEGTGYAATDVFILKGTKEEYTCQKIVDLFGTTEFCDLFCGLAGYVTKDPAVKSALYGGAPYYIPNIDEGWAATNKKRLCDEWKDRIGRVAR